MRLPTIATRYIRSATPTRGTFLINAGRYDEAVNSIRRTIELSPAYTEIRYALAIALLGQGEPEAALIEIQKEPSVTLRRTGESMIYHYVGNGVDSDEALQELITLNNDDSDFMAAQVYAYRGEVDEAFNWIRAARENKNWRVSELHINSLFSNLHSDPRWLVLLEEMGVSPAQLAAIRFKVVLPE